MSNNFGTSFVSIFNAKRVEPEKRLVGGRWGWAIHRYPIKGGISPHDSMNRDLSGPGLLSRLKARMPE